jgi:solute carrier family 35 protein F1/2
MIGLFGSLWTLIASFVYEREAIIDLFADKQMLLPTLGIICWYIVSLVAYYIFESTFLTKSDATLLNLSLQTSNFYAILFSVIAFREIPDIQFFVATVFVISGVFVYELCGNNDYYSTQRFCQRKQHDNELINNNGDVVTSQKTIYQSIETINI